MQNMYTVADYIAEFLSQIGCTSVHGLMGGGAAGLNDGFIRNDKIDYLCYHHEQGAAYAALGEARLTGKWAVINPTTGCGGGNCYTPILNAWQDSIPLVAISGNVNIATLATSFIDEHGISIRSYGVQEHDIISSIANVTKYARLVKRPTDIESIMVNAFFMAAEGRKGPTWIDVPADVQHSQVTEKLFGNIHNAIGGINRKLASKVECLSSNAGFSEIVERLGKCERPLILVGGGVSNNLLEKEQVNEFVCRNNIPVVATYAGTNVVSHDYPLYLGAIGIKGNRAANFALQNCDLLIVLGSRLPFAAIGYDISNFAVNARICVVDIDENELKKNRITFSNRIYQVQSYASAFCKACSDVKLNISAQWLERCNASKIAWDIIDENKRFFDYDGISIYHVMEELNKRAYDGCNFVVDAGSISYVAPTSLKYNPTRNFIFSPAQADMGCALPSSLGVAAKSDKRTICITGDGSLMSNIQELASVAQLSKELTVIVLNNRGYLSITNTQSNNYGPNRVYGEHEGRGLKFPEYKLLCEAFSLKFSHIRRLEDLSILKDSSLKFVQVDCLEIETIAPYQARINGKQAGPHDMAPFLDKEELISYSSAPIVLVR